MTAASGVRTRKPRYVEVADELRAQIMSGDLAVAEGFPTENVLCARYEVSRFTIREALRTLQNEGLIQRRRGSGTIVQPAAARGGALHQPLSNVGEILQYARDSTFTFAREGSCALPRVIAEQAGALSAGRWARFRGVRTRGGEAGPIALTDAFLHPELADVADCIDTDADTIFRQVERLAKLRIAHITQDIQAVPAGRGYSGGAESPPAQRLFADPALLCRCKRADHRNLRKPPSRHPVRLQYAYRSRRLIYPSAWPGAARGCHASSAKWIGGAI